MNLIAKISQKVNYQCDGFLGYSPNYEDGLLLPHNQKVYNKIVKGFSESNKVLVVQATGTGKSYLILKLLKDHAIGKKVLYITPTSAIESYFVDDVLKKYMTDYKKQINFTSCLYPSVKKYTKEKYDFIIIDEVHHVGAKEWGKAVDDLLTHNPQASVLGVTATLERQDGIDVTKFFENRKPVSKITLIDAMQQGILQAPDYVLGKIDFGADVEFINKSVKELQQEYETASDIDKEKIKQFLVDLKHAKRMISETKQIPQTIKEKLNTEKLKNGKYIVFCPAGLNENEDNASEIKMEQTMAQAKDWFGLVNSDIRQYAIHSLYGKKHNKQALKEFQEDNKQGLKLMFTVNMLNEGLHAGDIDGVIMLRPTGSQTIYTQQIGRALSAKSHTHQRLIFDFVANLQSLETNQIKEMAEKVNAGADKIDSDNDGETYTNEKDTAPKFNLKIENLETIQFIEKLKKNLSTFDDRFDFEFEDFYSRLVAYKAEFGDLLVPREYKCKDGYKLGEKVHNVRQGIIKLEEEQEQSLKDIGFVQDAKKVFDFEKFYNYLLEYKKDHDGSVDVPQSYVIKDEAGEIVYRLGRTIANVRSGNQAISNEQKERLKAIGFKSYISTVVKFEDIFAHLMEFKAEYNHLLVPQDYVSPDGFNLGNQVMRLRTGEKKIIKQERQRLDDEGFVWDASKKSNFKFEEFYEHLKKHGTCDVVRTFVCEEDGYPLGAYVSYVRLANKGESDPDSPYYNKEEGDPDSPYYLTKSQKQLLDDEGFIWVKRKSFNFDEYLAHLKEYNLDPKHNEIINQNYTSPDGYELGKITLQIRSGKIKLNDDQGQKQKLDNEGFIWDISANKFEKLFNYLLLYKLKYGDLLVPQTFNITEKNDSIYRLGLQVSKLRAKHSKMPKDQIQRLDEIGFVWDVKKYLKENSTGDTIN